MISVLRVTRGDIYCQWKLVDGNNERRFVSQISDADDAMRFHTKLLRRIPAPAITGNISMNS